MRRMTGWAWLYVVMALTGGVLGGILSNRIWPAAPAIAAQNAPKTMAAQEILLVDGGGQPRASLHLNQDGMPVFQMFDHAGKSRLVMGFGKEHDVGLALADDKGVTRVIAGITSDAIPSVRLFDDNKRQRALIGVDSEGEAALDFYESNGKLLRELP